MHEVDDGTAYSDRALSYACKMFMKLTAGFNAIKLFLSLNNKDSKPFQLSLTFPDKGWVCIYTNLFKKFLI